MNSRKIAFIGIMKFGGRRLPLMLIIHHLARYFWFDMFCDLQQILFMAGSDNLLVVREAS
jgi:hypothetical protein